MNFYSQPVLFIVMIDSFDSDSSFDSESTVLIDSFDSGELIDSFDSESRFDRVLNFYSKPVLNLSL